MNKEPTKSVKKPGRQSFLAEWISTMKRIFQLFVMSVVLFGFYAVPVQAQSAVAPDALFKTIEALDARFFAAYNRCDLPTISSLVSEDLEFYHDKTGLARGRQSLVDGIKNNICGKVSRELVPGTLQVYPIANYGAVEIGVHRFRHPGRDDDVGEAQFITLWQKKDEGWQITRVISFDHHSLSK
jgi:ketosteroid isomerase-like protein